MLKVEPAPVNSVTLTWHGPAPDAIEACSNLSSNVWTPLTNKPVQSGEADYKVVLPAQLASRYYRLVYGYMVQFQTLSNSFAPRIDCSAGAPASLRWNWSDGSTATNWPIAVKTFSSQTNRFQRLTFSPATAVTSINLGFDGSDDGWTNQIPARPPQAVSSVNFVGPLPNLQVWASSYNYITNLDFTGFLSLQCVECYRCRPLERAVVKNLPSLRRVCFEDCKLSEMDLSGDVNLEEVRAAGNVYTNIIMEGGVGPRIWHWCTRDNPLRQQFATFMTNFYSLQDYYAWNDNQAGLLKLVSTNLTQVAAYSNLYTHADLNGHSNMWLCQVFRNNLTNLLIDGCTGLRHLDANHNQLPTSVLDRLLAQLDTNAPALYYADLTYNAQRPSSAGYAHYTNIKRRGVAIYVDGR